MAFVLVCAIFVPVAMAKEDESPFSNNAIPAYDLSQMSSLNEDETKDLENIITLLLKAEGIQISNLDVSKLNVLKENQYTVFAGSLTFSIDNSPQKLEIYVSQNTLNNSFEIFSKSDSQYFNTHIYKTDENKKSVEYRVEQTYIKNGVSDVEIQTFSCKKQIDTIGSSSEMITGINQVHDFASCPPSNSNLIVNDVTVEEMISYTGLALGIIGLLTGLVPLDLVGLGMELYLLSGASAGSVEYSDIFVDVFSSTYLWPVYTPTCSNAYGIWFPPPVCAYFELDYYIS
ncbi:hypothetical protein [Methanolapillus ohkumae]